MPTSHPLFAATVTVSLRHGKRGYAARAGRGRKARTASSKVTAQLAVRRAAAKFFRLCPRCNVLGPADLFVDELVDVGSFAGHRTFEVHLPKTKVEA